MVRWQGKLSRTVLRSGPCAQTVRRVRDRPPSIARLLDRISRAPVHAVEQAGQPPSIAAASVEEASEAAVVLEVAAASEAVADSEVAEASAAAADVPTFE